MGGITTPWIFLRSVANQDWCLWKDRKEDGKESPYKYGQLIFGKIVKAIQWKSMLFPTNGAIATGYLWARKKKKKNLNENSVY